MDCLVVNISWWTTLAQTFHNKIKTHTIHLLSILRSTPLISLTRAHIAWASPANAIRHLLESESLWGVFPG